jgi:recombination protein RecA
MMFGNPETTTGGNALKFFASQRLEIRKWEKIEEQKDQVGYFAKIKVVKNKISAPFKTCEIAVKWKQWFDKILDIVESGIAFGIISRAGAFYTIAGQKIQWREKVIQLIETDEKLKKTLETEIQSKIKELRMGKNVVDEKALEAMEESIEATDEE